MSENLDKNAKKVDKLVSKYIKSPLHKRTSNKYDAILKKISNGLKQIEKLKDIINDIDSDHLVSKYDKRKINTKFSRLEEIMKLNMSSMSIDEKTELFLEYNSLLNWCNTHIQKRTFTVIEI